MSLPKKTLCINIRKIYKPYVKKEIDLNKLLKIINLRKSKFNSIVKNNKNKHDIFYFNKKHYK